VAHRYYKAPLFALCLVPFAVLAWQAATADLGANPVEALLHRSGAWTLRFLLLALAVTPVRLLTGWGEVLHVRRMLGLFAFFYASVHFTIYAVLDLGLDWRFITEDIAERPYLTVGFTAWLLLVPLAVTSTRAMMRRLGRRWKRLHRLVYGIAILGVLHFYWLVKADVREPLIYAGILMLLFGIRIAHRARRAVKLKVAREEA